MAPTDPRPSSFTVALVRGALLLGCLLAGPMTACSQPVATRGPRSSAPEGGASSSSAEDERAQIEAVLDDWHRAASEADGARYFEHFSDDAVFLGSDASERWTIAQFRALYGPYFDSGRGWTCVPRDRFVALSPGADIAWVDELLEHATYGTWRGTGVLKHTPQGWKVAHYSMTFTVPNEVSAAVVEACKGDESP